MRHGAMLALPSISWEDVGKLLHVPSPSALLCKTQLMTPTSWGCREHFKEMKYAKHDAKPGSSCYPTFSLSSAP